MTSWSVRWWLLTLSFGVGVPLLALLGWMFSVEVRRERAEARAAASRIARGTAARLRALHADSSALLARMAERPGMRSTAAECDALFAVVDFFPQYVNLFLFDRDGRLRCSANPDHANASISHAAQRWTAEAIRRGHTPGRPMIRAINQRWVSVLSTATPAGILALVQLPDLAGREALPESTVVTIVDSNGVVLARSSDPQRWTGRSVRGTEVTEIVLRDKEGRAEAKGIDGVSRQYGFTSLPEMGWHIYVGIPTAEVMAPARALMLRGLIAGALLVLVVMLFALRLGRAIQKPIDALARAAHVVAKEGYTAHVPVEGPREVAMLGEAFNEMVTGRARNEQALKALSDRLIAVQEQERTRIARELHDDLGQLLTALKMDITGILDSAAGGAAAVRERIRRTLDMTTEAVQRISAELRPSQLDDLGLVAAIEAEARLFEERTAIECDLSLDPLQLDSDTSTAIYRIVQEAFTNVARHADATRVEIRLRRRADEVVVEVRDDGRGITPDEIADADSLGLIGIRERAAILGGSVHIEGIAGRGTIVSVRFPAERGGG